MDLQNKISIITGAGQGIGEGIAKVLVAQGSKVVLVDLNEESVDKVSSEINAVSPNAATFFKADLTNSTEITGMLDFAMEQHGRIDCFCNNAAASKGLGPVESYSLEDVQTTIDLTFTILWRCLQAEIKLIKKHNLSASIVNISSNSALKGYAFNSIYAASKAAVNNLTQSVAKEIASLDIRVNAISPGTINTPGVQHYFAQEPKAKEFLERSALLNRIGEPAEVGELAAFLLSDRASFISGQIISVDGGAAIK